VVPAWLVNIYREALRYMTNDRPSPQNAVAGLTGGVAGPLTTVEKEL